MLVNKGAYVKENVIDLTAIQGIRRLQKPGRPDLLKELIALFIESTADNMKTLRTAVTNNDLETVSRIAHILKSSAANLGANKLSQTCYELEKIGNTEIASAQLAEVFSRTEADYTEAVESLKKF